VRSAGFSLVETLVALVLTLMVTGTAMALVMPASRVSQTQPEVMDVQQRARVAAESIARDVASAGAGIYAGPLRGVLTDSTPAVLPRRLGAQSGDGPDVARSSAITVLSVPATASQTTTATTISSGALALSVNAAPICGAAALCGLLAGQDVIVKDATGHFDIFRITRIVGAVATLRHHGQDLAWSYPAGSTVSQVISRTYDFDAAARQLRQYDGDQSDQPAVDHLAAVSFSYWGTGVGGSGLAELPLSTFTDGPWMGVGTTRFDTDLLRVRVIRVVVSSESAVAALRSRVPAFPVLRDISPRSLSVGR